MLGTMLIAPMIAILMLMALTLLWSIQPPLPVTLVVQERQGIQVGPMKIHKVPLVRQVVRTPRDGLRAINTNRSIL